MEQVKAVIQWLGTLPDYACVGIDEGGLCLREVCDGEIRSFLEIGGIPEDIENRWKSQGRRNTVASPPAPQKVDRMEQLMLDLEATCEKVTNTVAELRHEASCGSPVDKRKTANRLVGILSTQRGLSFHSVWVLAYHELYTRTGFHAVVSSKGKGTHLDSVESAGRMNDLVETLLSMLQS